LEIKVKQAKNHWQKSFKQKGDEYRKKIKPYTSLDYALFQQNKIMSNFNSSKKIFQPKHLLKKRKKPLKPIPSYNHEETLQEKTCIS